MQLEKENMQYGYLLSGGKATIKKYKMAAAIVEGVVVLVSAANSTGLSTSTTTSWTDSVGLTVDGGAIKQGVPVLYSTVQGQDEFLQSVLINPDAVLRALLVGSAANAALTPNPVLTAASNGLTVVATNTFSNQDEGTIWYISGANAGRSRKITSVSTTTATVSMPFAGNAVGDNALAIAQAPGSIGVTLSTNLLNVRADNIALGSDAVARTIDYELNDVGSSYVHLIQTDHAFGTN